ncbi:MAG: ABC transporter permease, partial [Proteobacteria bacterium]|nr:ABC transporter permease [Pseudomonadota bacterium]
IASLIPLTLGIDGLRQVLVVSDYPTLISWEVETVIMFFYALIALRFSKYTLNYMEKSARESGTLTLKWQ